MCVACRGAFPSLLFVCACSAVHGHTDRPLTRARVQVAMLALALLLVASVALAQPCPAYGTCEACASGTGAQSGCGWCQASAACVAGTAAGAATGYCANYAYVLSVLSLARAGGGLTRARASMQVVLQQHQLVSDHLVCAARVVLGVRAAPLVHVVPEEQQVRGHRLAGRHLDLVRGHRRHDTHLCVPPPHVMQCASVGARRCACCLLTVAPQDCQADGQGRRGARGCVAGLTGDRLRVVRRGRADVHAGRRQQVWRGEAH